MGKTLKRTVSLPQAAADYIDRKVDSGEYGSASEVVREGLRALRERDAAIEKWLREEVVPTYEAVKADPSQLLDADEVFDAIEDRHRRLSSSDR
ncbi:MAG: type II toxin-antitoxin system ParD family antitoxin [Roseitalea porphyridii]|jgi:antitoxin ParD1/3/4|uniref:Type II toxin-antitoxin system ParD family antitoxin n=1 Tax=Roseitalea porphyridii TaxID=1852022 RepID=A0A4P6UZP0_9HYPH|nr:type II toxin-antitoxin system ParD family antitoxin [Roseitalea porphyridii]QBK30522.1 type II toxin-antitoxin system ParD family antitoxin [Roseitalea porphyridii]